MRGAQLSPLARNRASSIGGNLTGAAVTIGVVVAATALVEVALIPGLAVGAAAVVTPRLLSRRRRRAQSRPSPSQAGRVEQASGSSNSATQMSKTGTRSLHLKEATLKTVSFRVIMTAFDFGFNYVILGELVTAAGLSTFSIVAGPFFYFVHETGWTYLKPLLPASPPNLAAAKAKTDYELFGYRLSHALAKTITYRLFATASEFSTNYVVVRDLTTAAWLSAFGFFVGPFIYFAHERFWEAMQIETEPLARSKLTPPPISQRTIYLKPA